MLVTPPNSLLETWLVITPAEFNRVNGFFWGVPMTRESTKENPFEVVVKQNQIQGILLPNQLQCVPYTPSNLILHTTLNRTEFAAILDFLESVLRYEF
jgi:mRNA-degrading endonuclease toxin of MazEF toxin-antitoxin module